MVCSGQLLHGFIDSWRSFERVLPHLPASIRAFALTQRGPTGYRFRDFAADLAAFLDALHLKAAVIAGDSMGSFVAQRFAIDHPERTLGIVLMGSCTSLRDRPGVRELWDSTVSKLADPVDVSQSDQQALVAAIAASRLVLYPGAGHQVHWEEPRRFASDLVALVEALRFLPHEFFRRGSSRREAKGL
jgi:pimeloyl-ACP methyl ester carboxylesterase